MMIAPRSAREIVRVPAGSTITIDGRRSTVGEVVIDYENGMLSPKPLPERKVVASKARRISVPKFTPMIDGKVDEWKAHASTPLHLTTGGRGTFEADASFAWDDQFMYVMVRQTRKAKDVHEADELQSFSNTPWDWDAANFFIDLGNGTRPSLGDFVLQLSWGSKGQKDIAFSAQAPDDGAAKIASATSGSNEKADRVIEARVSWAGIAAAAFGEGAKPDVKAGTTIGCEPALVELNHTRQSFIGGSQYQRPTGTDSHSIDLVLRQ